MYWLYLAIFIAAILTPDLIRKNFHSIGEERLEQLTILFLGVIGLLFYLIKEKQLYHQLKAKKQIMREASLATKDLAETYSYIGELNRKIDILSNITLSFYDTANFSEERKKELYREIIHAIQLFTKSKRVSLRFFDDAKNHIVYEIKNNSKVKCDPSDYRMPNGNKAYFETDEYFIIRSPKSINNISACIVIEKKNRNQKIENLQIIKSLAAKALFLYHFREAMFDIKS